MVDEPSRSCKEMTHDLELNLHVIMPFGKEDTAKELQIHATKTQDTWVGAVVNAEVTVIEHAVSRSRNRWCAATTKKIDTKETTQFKRIDHEQVGREATGIVASENAKESMFAMTAAELIEKLGLRNLRHRQ